MQQFEANEDVLVSVFTRYKQQIATCLHYTNPDPDMKEHLLHVLLRKVMPSAAKILIASWGKCSQQIFTQIF